MRGRSKRSPPDYFGLQFNRIPCPVTAAAVKLACKGVWKLFGPDPAGFPAHRSRPPRVDETVRLVGRKPV